MSQLRKVLLTRHIDLQDGGFFFAGETVTDAETARELVAKGASYVDDDDYNKSITAAPKVEPQAAESKTGTPKTELKAPATQPKDNN